MINLQGIWTDFWQPFFCITKALTQLCNIIWFSAYHSHRRWWAWVKKKKNDRKPVSVLCWRCVEQNDDHVRHSPDSLADHTLISIHRERLEAARTSSACWARLIAHIGGDTVKPSVWTEGTPICLTMKREILLSPASDAPRAWRRGSNAGNAVTGFACDGKAGVFRFTSGAEIMHKLAAITVFIHYLSASINQLMLRPVK